MATPVTASSTVTGPVNSQSWRLSWLLVSHYDMTRVRIDCHGEVTTVAGKPGVEGTADGAARAEARFCRPWSLALHPESGCLYVGERTGQTNARVRCLDLAARTVLSLPDSDGLGHCGLAAGADGELLLCDGARGEVLALAADGQIYVAVDAPAGGGGPVLPGARAIGAAAQGLDRDIYVPDAAAHCIFAVHFGGSGGAAVGGGGNIYGTPSASAPAEVRPSAYPTKAAPSPPAKTSTLPAEPPPAKMATPTAPSLAKKSFSPPARPLPPRPSAPPTPPAAAGSWQQFRD